jgi:hypothetical protein
VASALKVERLEQMLDRLAQDLATDRASRDKTNWRRTHEARVRLLWPSLSADEIATLEDYEVDTQRFEAAPAPAEFQRTPSEFMKSSDIADPRRYVYFLNGEYVDVPSGDLPAPELSISDLEGLHPIVSLKSVSSLGRRFVLPYYEIDTTPTFDSPHLWRAPSLVPDFGKFNAVGRKGEVLHVHYSSQRRADAYISGVRFPFRVTAMALPLSYGEMSFDDLERQAQLLAHGLSAGDTIREIYMHIRHTYSWGFDTVTRHPIDTFLARTGMCGHVNDLLGAMLEVNGLRYRLVGGFSPRWRLIFPGGGHAAIEVLDPATRKWSYADPYLDVFAHQVSAEEVAQHELGRLPVFTPEDDKVPTSFGAQMELRELFRFRTYGDFSMRLPMARMTQLFGREHDYGLTWPLRKRSVELQLDKDIPERTTIFVRARYLASDCPIRFGGEKLPICDPSKTTASPWTMKSFEIRPRDLLRGAAASQPDTEPEQNSSPPFGSSAVQGSPSGSGRLN